MGADNQNQNTVTSEIQNNNIETEQFNEKTYNNNKDPSQREIINEKPQEESHQQNDENQHPTNQFTLNLPVTVSDVLDGKVTLPTPAPKKSVEQIAAPENKNDNIKVPNEKRKQIKRLSTTDSMQEFLEIPDNVEYSRENDEEGNNEKLDNS